MTLFVGFLFFKKFISFKGVPMSLSEKHFGTLYQKFKYAHPFMQQHHFQEDSHRSEMMRIFIAAIFLKNWKQPKCP